ncbi:NINE protein [Mesomycoplasma neurolyticum]|uniref:TM2 domain n=1 Tax=Mesomycoplasma neurolyticum TaxID=2120 RepID=A0A449A4W6_9BACT|nr:NINE protein [Mesomycoplasma neurolyticum]VEU59285.1 Uncharacterised protein [Mesomycoplasma neurolyticum]
MTNFRKDGKSKSTLFWLSLFGGLFGLEYFYVNKKLLGLLKLYISWIGATLIVIMWILYGSILNKEGLPVISYYDVKIVSIFGSVILVFNGLWTIYNTVAIFLGIFLDENKKPINTWNDKHIEYIDSLLELKKFRKENNG